MKDRLGIQMENSGRDTTVVTLAGFLRADSLDELRARVRHLVEDGAKILLFDLQNAEIRGDEARAFFLDVLDDMKGRGGRVALVARRYDVVSYFSGMRNLLPIYPNRAKFKRSDLFQSIRRQMVAYSKKTGVRLSPAMALLLVLLIASWIFNLASANDAQAERLERQRALLAQYETERLELQNELDELKRKLAPLNQLGLVSDSLMAAGFTATDDWIDHLEDRFRRKQRADSLKAEEEARAAGKGNP